MNFSLRRTSVVLTALLAGSAPVATAFAASSPATIEFNRDVRPILSENCYHCHGPDKSNRKAKLQLDVRDLAIAKGAIVPGKVEESELIKRIFTKDEDDLMPPAESHKKLTAAQKETLKKWIAAGANYEPHWSYTPVRRPEPAAVKDKAWVKNPVDTFILHALEEKSIKPSAEADKRTLLRRLSLDLTGLPPSESQIQAFLADKSPKAYEKQVDALLASPHYGERMAVPWLDLVRFADTVGYHGDQNQNVFPYRDYVIDSFNRNKPFDQFTIEQIAGDLLPNPTPEQRIATGFNRLNMMTREGGAQPKEYLSKYTADRVRTVSTTWMGSTLGCAECHDHKFDPFSTKDFYSMGAFFADVKQWGVYGDYGYTPNPDLRGFNNEYPFPPEMEVTSQYLLQRQKELLGRIQEVQAQSASALKAGETKEQFTAWKQASLEFLKTSPSGWQTPPPEVVVVKGTKGAKNVKLLNKAEAEAMKKAPPADTNFVVNADHSVLFFGKAATTNEIRLPLEAGWVAAVRLELLPDVQHTNSVLRGGATMGLLQIGAALNTADGKSTRLAFYHSDADLKDPVYLSGRALPSLRNGWRADSKQLQSPQTAVWLLDAPVKVEAGQTLVVTLLNNLAGKVRVSVSPFAALNPVDPKLGENMAKALKAGKDAAFGAYLTSTAWNKEAFGEYKKLQAEYAECRDGKTQSLITEAWEPRPMRVLPRGNWQDETGEPVVPAPPHFLPQPVVAKDARLTRLDLAKWMVAPENPLTARVFVNRLWKQFFGTGISTVVDDLGAQGEWPVHPELLDWLASEFMKSGWDVKHVVKQIVTSATYRQDSNQRQDLKDLDPGNRWLASQSPRRLEAEFVRDNALAVAGLLNLDIGGPSAHPYQPADYYVNIQFPNRSYRAETDDRQYRRGIYAHWQRTFLHPMMANFDAPSREECTAIRTVSNTPQQALTLLNDPTFVEAACVFAQRLLASKGDDGEKLERAFQQALARPVKANEKESLLKFLADQRGYYHGNPEEAKKLLTVGAAAAPTGMNEGEVAAWATVCRVVLNLHETITRY